MAEPNDKTASEAPQPQPGQVVAPGAAEMSNTQQSTPAPMAPQTPPAQPSPTPAVQAADEAQVPFNQEEAAPSDPHDANISWTASEFVAHEKSTGWYGGLLIVTLVIAGFVYLLTRDVISTTVVVIAAAALGVLAARKPQQRQYRLDGSGITVGQKHYDYELFRSFSVMPEGAFSSIVFMPLKRFAPLTTIYYAPEDEDKIIDVLTKRLPFEEHKTDAVDSLMRHIRF